MLSRQGWPWARAWLWANWVRATTVWAKSAVCRPAKNPFSDGADSDSTMVISSITVTNSISVKARS